MAIRPVSKKEMQREVLPFIARQMQSSYTWLNPEGLAATINYKQQTLASRFPKHGVLLGGWQGGELVATVSFEYYDSPSGRALVPVYYGNLFVDPVYQGDGWGKRMNLALERAALGSGATLLLAEVLAPNYKAKSFLIHHGFLPCGGGRTSGNSGERVEAFAKGLVC